MTRPNSIKAIGVKKYLNNSKDDHNGFGYETFEKMLTLKKRPSATSMGHVFNVSAPTMIKWIEIYENTKQD